MRHERREQQTDGHEAEHRGERDAPIVGATKTAGEFRQ
jgi:hypothetical protein